MSGHQATYHLFCITDLNYGYNIYFFWNFCLSFFANCATSSSTPPPPFSW